MSFCFACVAGFLSSSCTCLTGFSFKTKTGGGLRRIDLSEEEEDDDDDDDGGGDDDDSVEGEDDDEILMGSPRFLLLGLWQGK